GADRGTHRHSRHDLDTAGHCDIDLTGYNSRRGEVNRLLRRAALAVNRRTRNRLGPAGAEHSVATDIEALLADLADHAPDDVVDDSRVDTRALGESTQDVGGQVHRVDVLVSAVAATHGCPNSIDDDGVTHGGFPSAH